MKRIKHWSKNLSWMVGSLPVGSKFRSPLPLSMSCTKQRDFLTSRPQPADQPQQNNVSAIIHLQQLTAGYNLHIPWGQDMAPNHVTKKMIPAISGSTRFRMKLPTKSDGPALASSGISQNPTKETCLTTLHSFSTTTVTFGIVQNCRDPANFTKLMSYPSCYKSSSTFLPINSHLHLGVQIYLRTNFMPWTYANISKHVNFNKLKN